MTQSEKVRQNDEEIIKELCVCNGVSYEKVREDGSGVEALEAFFSGFPRMVGLSLFPRLLSLTIVGQNVRKIQGLDDCPRLRELWVAECQLTEISGLQKCVQLQKLFLYDNKISEMSGMESLINLSVLWINNNLVTEIKGLSTLENLTELNLADNLITTIGKSLEQSKNLQSLNLSGNKISSFKELTQLACLTELRELGLNDPQSSPNPVCVLCNYFTHVLYHIPMLHTLDSYDVSAKNIKEAAESTVMKKRMYYHMRVRCVQRQLDQTKHTLQLQKKKLRQIPEDRIHTLSYTLKHLECEYEAAGRQLAGLREEVTSQGSGEYMTSDLSKEMKMKLKAIRERIKFWEQRLEEVEARFQQDVAMASDRKDMSIHFLVMELETVGNIRFEEGNTSHAWFKPCYDLLLSRFCVWDFKAYNITGLKINRIVRVHNRVLRLRFEDRLHALLANNESSLLSQNYKRRLEYLFYVFDPEEIQRTNEILNILEKGFKSADGYKALGRDCAVPLSNSVSACEEPHVRFVRRKATRRGTESAENPLPFTQGQLIITKAFLGHSVPLRAGAPVDAEFYPKAHSVYLKASAKQHITKQGNTGEVYSSELQGCCDCSQRKTLWYVFDRELVLPEYLIDFEYVTQERSQSSCPPKAPAAPDDVTPGCNDEQALDEQVLSLQPVPKPRPKLLSLDESSVLTAARANVLSQITVLNLHGNSLSRLKEISRLTALRQLIISFNALTHLDDVSHLPNLECVDASFNQIVTLEGVRGLPRLRELDLRWNQLSRVREETSVLRKHTPSLLRLHARHNPWSQGESVRMVVLGQLKNLTHLDGVLVTEEEVAAATHVNSTSKINLMLLLSHSRTDADRPRCLSLLTAAQLLTHLKPSPWKHTTDLEPGWGAKVTALNLDGQRLSHISNLEQLVNLRWASFNNNQLTHIEGLQHCPLLEELSLNHNYICTLEGACKLQRLTRLSINSNQLRCLDASVLDRLTNLHFLSAEDNCISSLQGVQRSRSLFELYVSNNNISTSRDIYHLKTLSNLIILDLYGNPLTRTLENYRAYLIFHLPSLKALDGTAVEMSECENAKDVFGGRLTADMLAEKLGQCDYREMEELELPGCSVRTVDLAPAELFVNLHSVNLERNNLTSFSGLVYLPNVKVLCLNYNHIESILPRQKTHTHLSSRQQLYQKVHSSGYGQQISKSSSKECVCVESLEPLMCSLEVLHLGYNGISNLSDVQLSRLSGLRALFLQGNEIVQVEGLDGLSLLRELVLDQNRVKTLSEKWFSSHTRLIELSLNDNRLRSLTHLQLTHLQRLHLSNNKLQDITELDKLEVLTSLVELSVVGNPVARRSLHRPSVVLRLPQLQVLDGITVTLEERTRAELLCTEDTPSCVDGAFPVVLSRAPPARNSALGVGTHHLLGHESFFSAHAEDTHCKRTDKRQRPGVTHTRSAQSNTLRGVLSLTGLLHNGHRAYITHTESESRYPSGTKPPPRNTDV
ncbi:leucine-rich repeat-containing protein 9 isoform X1 [Pangasianodon hypophthalmus]|uniref:leucine-rich repeat-containing protein 9 isoform X1 n=1 Tax=Pangasianodon hypophthalmus TaxID=310915 RepID=UPI002307BE15|nr:leucine-rich repeat-containing protein 9 isoform X1 [Pangasianodon hypophthalmus]